MTLLISKFNKIDVISKLSNNPCDELTVSNNTRKTKSDAFV